MKIKQMVGLCFIVVLLTGCGTTRKMVLDHTKGGQLDTSKESIVLLRLTTDNWHAPKYPPKVATAAVHKIDGDKVDKMKVKFEKAVNAGTDYLASIQLPPGEYQIRNVDGTSGVFPVHGRFSIPLYSKFIVEPEEIVYIGKVDAIVRKRENDDQLRSGPVLPLIDQSVSGFATGTFDITISDDYGIDVPAFKEQFPFLSNYTIQRRVMDSWRQPTEEEMKSKK